MSSTTRKPLPWNPAVKTDERLHADFIESHIDLVRYLALRISTRLPASVDTDDLINDGIVGLLDATNKFNPDRGVRFRTYAETRIRGAILDGLRQKDWRPRSVRMRQRDLDHTIGLLATVNGRPATDEEIAKEMGLDMKAYRTLLEGLHVGPFLSLEDLSGGDPSIASDQLPPDAPLEKRDLVRAMVEEIRSLPERERHILELYYNEGLTMKEIGSALGVTESRVCQLHSQAAARLRSALAPRIHAAPQKKSAVREKETALRAGGRA